MNRDVVRSQNFVHDGAEFILRHARAALAERDQFRIALSGGNTPRPVYTEFARIARGIPWDRVHFTFGDERCVPPDDPQSNYRMARESLFVLARSRKNRWPGCVAKSIRRLPPRNTRTGSIAWRPNGGKRCIGTI